MVVSARRTQANTIKIRPNLRGFTHRISFLVHVTTLWGASLPSHRTLCVCDSGTQGLCVSALASGLGAFCIHPASRWGRGSGEGTPASRAPEPGRDMHQLCSYSTGSHPPHGPAQHKRAWETELAAGGQIQALHQHHGKRHFNHQGCVSCSCRCHRAGIRA